MARYTNKKETTEYINGNVIRIHNRRIKSSYHEKGNKTEENEPVEEDHIEVLIHSALPKKDLSFNGNNIRLNRKQTGFKLSIEQALLLHESLSITLGKYVENVIGEDNLID